jgi:hypothetical protein
MPTGPRGGRLVAAPIWHLWARFPQVRNASGPDRNRTGCLVCTALAGEQTLDRPRMIRYSVTRREQERPRSGCGSGGAVTSPVSVQSRTFVARGLGGTGSGVVMGFPKNEGRAWRGPVVEICRGALLGRAAPRLRGYFPAALATIESNGASAAGLWNEPRMIRSIGETSCP